MICVFLLVLSSFLYFVVHMCELSYVLNFYLLTYLLIFVILVLERDLPTYLLCIEIICYTVKSCVLLLTACSQ